MAGFQQLRVTKKVNFTGAVKIGMGDYSLGKGKTYYVDDAGADGNEGLDPNYPMLTIKAALARCTSSIGDAVVTMAKSPSTPSTGEDWPINLNKAGVLLTGLYSRGLVSDSGFGSGTINVATLNIAANYVTVENLYLGCKSTGNTGGIVTFTGSTYASTFRNVVFDIQYVAAYGILVAADQPYLLVEDCIFGRGDVAGYTTACISLSNATFGMIRRNVFQGFAGIGVSIGAACGNCSVLANYFRLPSDTAGKAVTCAAGSSGNFIAGNYATFGSVDPANDAYKDLSTADYNDWGPNWNGSSCDATPATS